MDSYFLIPKRFSQQLALSSLLLALLSGLFIVPAYSASPPQPSPAAINLINRANGFANQEQFAEAIPLYEQALKQFPQSNPNYRQLKDNLQVLYVNHAVTLINNKQYTEADAVLNKALASDPNNTHAAKTKAAVLFSQAMDLRDSVKDGKQDFERIETLLKEAMALDPENKNFSRALAGNYFDNALALSEADRLEESALLMQAALDLAPTQSNIRISLVNVYLQLLNRSDEATRQKWQDKILALDTSEDTKARIAEITNPQPQPTATPYGIPTEGVITDKNNKFDKKSKLPASAARLSIQDMLLDVENQLGIPRDANASLKERLERAEEQLNGKLSDGPVAERVKTLYIQLYGSPKAEAPSQEIQTVLSEDALRDTYIAEIFKWTDGKVIRWGKFPLRVYVDEPPDKENAEKLDGLYQKAFKQSVLNGLDIWKEASGGSMSYIEVKNPSAADVQIYFDKAYVDRFADPEKVPELYQKYSPPKNRKLVQVLNIASMFTPGIFSLAPMIASTGLQYQQLKNIELVRKESEVTLGLESIKDLSAEQANLLIQNMAAKEFGRVLGLKATSPTPGDLLYPDLKSDQIQQPSTRDMATLRLLYSRPANIILNVQ